MQPPGPPRSPPNFKGCAGDTPNKNSHITQKFTASRQHLRRRPFPQGKNTHKRACDELMTSPHSRDETRAAEQKLGGNAGRMWGDSGVCWFVSCATHHGLEPSPFPPSPFQPLSPPQVGTSLPTGYLDPWGKRGVAPIPPAPPPWLKTGHHIPAKGCMLCTR